MPNGCGRTCRSWLPLSLTANLGVHEVKTLAAITALAILLSSVVGATSAYALEAWHDMNVLADFRYGIFCSLLDTGQFIEAPDALHGKQKTFNDTPPFLPGYNSVPSRDQIEFGVVANSLNKNQGIIEVVMQSPPLGASKLTQQAWKTYLYPHDEYFTFYRILLSDGNPAGLWSFTGWMSGAQIFRVEFELVSPNIEDDEFADPCKTMLIG